MEVLQPYRLWEVCEHKTIKPDPNSIMPWKSCKLDPEDKMPWSCEECPYGKAPEPMMLPATKMLRIGSSIEYANRKEEAFWRCPKCELDHVYYRSEKEGWQVFRCLKCNTTYIDWARAFIK